MNLSLRNQLSLWMVLAILVIVFSTIFVTQQITVWSLEKSLDQSIQKRAYMVAAIISSDITTNEESYARVISDLAGQELSFVPSELRIVSPDGNSIVEFGQMSDPVIQQLDAHLQSSETTEGHFDTITAAGNEPLRSYTVGVSDPRTHSTLAYVQVIESLNQIEETKQGLWRNGLIIGAIGSFLAIVIGQVLIRRGFKPLYTIVEAIDRSDYHHLKSRMHEDVNSVELQQLSRSLSAMWQRLDIAVSEKRKVIGNMSHDLRTPLTALQGQLEVLLSQPSLTVETRDSLTRMLSETRRLTRMVKNMLLNVQLESRPSLEFEDVNLKDILDETVGDVWTLSDGLEVNIASTEDVVISGGRDLLKQMLMNIIDNAIKFTPKGGKIELKLTQDGKWAIIQVSDTGRGIPNEQLPHVTEAFYKVGSSRKSAGEGARLGLAIVKQITELHQGQIEIHSREGMGTAVTVYLPLKNCGNSAPAG